MKPCIKLALSERQKQWAWFVGLWFAGLLSVASAGYLIKFLMSLI